MPYPTPKSSGVNVFNQDLSVFDGSHVNRRDTGGEGLTPHKTFQKIFQVDFSSASAVFSSCRHIPQTHFDERLVKIGCYGYEIWREK